jgi:hypothetical protein
MHISSMALIPEMSFSGTSMPLSPGWGGGGGGGAPESQAAETGPHMGADNLSMIGSTRSAGQYPMMPLSRTSSGEKMYTRTGKLRREASMLVYSAPRSSKVSTSSVRLRMPEEHSSSLLGRVVGGAVKPSSSNMTVRQDIYLGLEEAEDDGHGFSPPAAYKPSNLHGILK